MKTKKIGGLYIGEILAGAVTMCIFVAVMALAVNSVAPAFQ